VRLRIGILLWLTSWVPFAVIFGANGTMVPVIWTLQIIVGIAGLAICGHELAQHVKTAGWRHAPGIAWHVLLHGSGP
jgi:hypothetical protein